MIIKQQAKTIKKKRQPTRHTHYTNSLNHFQSLLQLNYISGIIQEIVTEGVGDDFKHSTNVLQLALWVAHRTRTRL